MTVKQIIKAYLEDHKFDGLTSRSTDCGCSKDDLFPCEDNFEKCEPAYCAPTDDKYEDTIYTNEKPKEVGT